MILVTQLQNQSLLTLNFYKLTISYTENKGDKYSKLFYEVGTLIILILQFYTQKSLLNVLYGK